MQCTLVVCYHRSSQAKSGWVQPDFATKFLDQLIPRICPIVKGPKPFVPRGFLRTIVAIKKSMVQLMEKITYLKPLGLADFHTFKPCTRCGRTNHAVQD